MVRLHLADVAVADQVAEKRGELLIDNSGHADRAWQRRCQPIRCSEIRFVIQRRRRPTAAYAARVRQHGSE